ncbi:MAG: YkgJ family cysteine cluster protein [Bradymonadales bacterium]|jgi:Fe-S-cluster containining protein
MKEEKNVEKGEDLKRVMSAVYASIDERVAQLEAGLTLRCTLGCCSCCIDGLSVAPSEAENIRLHYAEFLKSAEPQMHGLCAFLDNEGACRIYAQRPYVCRTHGLPLRWLDNGQEYRDICLLNEDVGCENLLPEQCWTLGAVEQHLMQVDQYFFGHHERVQLRELFEKE